MADLLIRCLSREAPLPLDQAAGLPMQRRPVGRLRRRSLRLNLQEEIGPCSRRCRNMVAGCATHPPSVPQALATAEDVMHNKQQQLASRNKAVVVTHVRNTWPKSRNPQPGNPLPPQADPNEAKPRDGYRLTSCQKRINQASCPTDQRSNPAA